MKRMLINATQEEELRMAMVDGQRLYDLNIEAPASERKKANIYKGKITRIEPSLEAAFVNYGAERHGFLPLKEISSEYFVKEAGSGKVNIKEVLREGQDIVVQIDKEERGNKGAALTTFVSLAGRFIVLKPNKARSGGVSRRITGDDRDAARKSLKNVEIPDGMSVILRTAGIDRTSEELAWDLENLLNVWQAILKVVVERPSPFLIYRESNAVVRALRDYLTNEIGEILIDDEATYVEAREFVEQVMPHNLRKLKHYTDPVPLFTRFQIESQIESAFAHTVHLPSGGSLVVDHTEALVSIDINSARATKGGDIEATALNTNLEAADEIARQLRLRDLGGLIVIDFIDMGPQKNQRDVENRLRDAVKQDRARIQIGKISRFGLLEMSRQRLRPSLGESAYLTCPRCSGIGNIRSVESLALAILRIIGEEARKERTAKVIAQLPVEVATYLLNEKRDWVQNLETSNDTQVVLVANELLETPHYRIRRVRDDQTELPENTGSSYTLSDPEDEFTVPTSLQDQKPAETAAVTTIVATTQAPPRKTAVEEPKTTPGFLARLAALFAGKTEDKEKKPAKKKAASAKRTKKKPADSRSSQRGRRKKEDGKDRSRGERAKKPTRKRAKKTDKQKDERAANSSQKPAEQQPEAKPDQSSDDARSTAPRKKRRSRGGRRRRKSADRGEAKADNQQQNQPAQDANADQATTRPQGKAAADQPADKQPESQGRQRSEKQGAASKEQPDTRHEAKPAEPRDRRDDASAPAKPVAAAPKQTDKQPVAAEATRVEPSRGSDTQVADRRPDAGSQKAGDKPSATATDKSTDQRQPRAAEVAKSSSSAAAVSKPAESGYDDTQPELPQLHVQSDAPPRKARAPQAADQSEINSKPPAEPGKPGGQAAAQQAKSEAKPKPETVAEDKPQGRLLPWEPQTPPAPAPTETSAEDKPA